MFSCPLKCSLSVSFISLLVGTSVRTGGYYRGSRGSRACAFILYPVNHFTSIASCVEVVESASGTGVR